MNDFAAFYAHHPQLELVAFNGRTAASLYRRHVLGTLAAGPQALPRVELPSTSPAHATLRPPAKLAAWRAALAGRLVGTRRQHAEPAPHDPA